MSTFKFWRAFFCLDFLRLHIGGSDSTSTTQTSQTYDQRQVNTTNIQTDGGAIAGTIALAGQVVAGANQGAVHAYDYADNIFDGALDFANMNSTRALNAYDRAAAITTQALSTASAAYADAKGTSASNKQIIIGVLVVAGIAVLAAIQARG